MSELMIAADNYSSSYAKCLYAATPEDQKLGGCQPAESIELSPEDTSRMRLELTTLSQDLKLVEDRFGEDVLNLALATGYLKSLLGNARVSRHLQHHFTKITMEFRKLLDAPELNGTD